jgi:hypothetical protein
LSFATIAIFSMALRLPPCAMIIFRQLEPAPAAMPMPPSAFAISRFSTLFSSWPAMPPPRCRAAFDVYGFSPSYAFRFDYCCRRPADIDELFFHATLMADAAAFSITPAISLFITLPPVTPAFHDAG